LCSAGLQQDFVGTLPGDSQPHLVEQSNLNTARHRLLVADLLRPHLLQLQIRMPVQHMHASFCLQQPGLAEEQVLLPAVNLPRSSRNLVLLAAVDRNRLVPADLAEGTATYWKVAGIKIRVEEASRAGASEVMKFGLRLGRK
jgi:hypothetical protein